MTVIQKLKGIRRTRQLRAACKTVGESPAGKVMLALLREDAFMDTSSFHPENDRMSAFREGIRHLYLTMLRHAQLTDEQIQAMTSVSPEDE